MGIIAALRFRRRLERDDLVAPQRLEKGLKASAYVTPHDSTVDFHLADASRALDDPGGRRAHKTDLYPAYRQLLSHGDQATRRAGPAKSVELLIQC